MNEYSPDHPANTRARGGKILQHRLVMECLLGRLLEPDEMVHHRNECRWDNRPKNLEVMTRAEHLRIHAPDRVRKRVMPTEDEVRQALVGRSTREAAEHLGVSKCWVYEHFPNLLTKIGYTPEQVQATREAAAAGKETMREFAARMGVKRSQVQSWSMMNKIRWEHKRPGRPLGSKTRKHPVVDEMLMP